MALQGEAQCCVTGPAFEQLLQLGDLPLLETVMRNVVVFSRMKPHQKGQVMDLLSTRGLHQLIDGQQHQFPVRRFSVTERHYLCNLQAPANCSNSANATAPFQSRKHAYQCAGAVSHVDSINTACACTVPNVHVLHDVNAPAIIISKAQVHVSTANQT